MSEKSVKCNHFGKKVLAVSDKVNGMFILGTSPREIKRYVQNKCSQQPSYGNNPDAL
jgi:hypothetical protein